MNDFMFVSAAWNMQTKTGHSGLSRIQWRPCVWDLLDTPLQPPVLPPVNTPDQLKLLKRAKVDKPLPPEPASNHIDTNIGWCQTFSSIKKISISFILQVEKTTEPGCYTSNVPLFVSGWKSSQKVWLPVRAECMINACTTTKSIALSNPPQCPSAKRGLAAPVNRSERLWIWDWTDCIITQSRARTRAHAHSHTHVNAYMIPINVYLKFCLSWGLIRTYAKGSKCV